MFTAAESRYNFLTPRAVPATEPLTCEHPDVARKSLQTWARFMPRIIPAATGLQLLLAVWFCTAESLAAAEPAKLVTFESDVQPLLTRFGCNAGACHGKARGQNGLALSLLGFDADFDFGALLHESRGRRVFPAAPEASLFLRKATGQMPHGGGKRFEVGGPVY